MKRLAFYAIVISVTLTLLILLWQFRSAVILLILSLVLTAALRPSVDFLVERGLRAGWARLLVYLLVFGILGFGLYLIIGPLLDELQRLTNYLVILYDVTYRAWENGSAVQQAVVGRVPPPDQLGELLAGTSGASALRLLFGVTQGAATVLAGLVVVIALSLYWSADRSHFERLWLSLLPAGQRIQARRIWYKTEGTMGAYLRSEFLQSVLAVIILAIGYRLIGLDYPILMALLAGVAWLIPLVGFVFAALISFLLGLASGGGLPLALGALAMTAAVLAFLEFFVEPRLFRRNQFSGVLIIVAIVMMVDAYGLTGFLIAPPLAVALQVSLSLIIKAIRRPPPPEVEIATIEQRIAAVTALYNGQAAPGGPTLDGATPDEPVVMPPEVASFINRLKGLVAEARQVALEE